MPKNQVKPEASEPYTEKIRLGKAIFSPGSVQPAPCRLKFSSKILGAAGLGPGYEVELVAGPGEILIRRIGGPKENIFNKLKNSNRNPFLDELMDMTRQHEARQRAEREGRPYPTEDSELNEGQLDREEL